MPTMDQAMEFPYGKQSKKKSKPRRITLFRIHVGGSEVFSGENRTTARFAFRAWKETVKTPGARHFGLAVELTEGSDIVSAFIPARKAGA